MPLAVLVTMSPVGLRFVVRLGPDIGLVTIGGALRAPGPSRWRRRPILAPAGGAPPLSLLPSAACLAVTPMAMESSPRTLLQMTLWRLEYLRIPAFRGLAPRGYNPLATVKF